MNGPFRPNPMMPVGMQLVANMNPMNPPAGSHARPWGDPLAPSYSPLNPINPLNPNAPKPLRDDLFPPLGTKKTTTW